jgi:sugar phosphate isomerase/epimerase
LMPDQRPTDASGWFAFGQRLQAAGKPLRDAGLVFGWHNHDFEFAALPDGSTPQEQIFAGGPELDWEADIAWVIRGGADPFAWIESYGKRISAVHVKDIAPAGENTDEDGWADVGHGTVDWKGLIAALKSTRVKHFVVEHDNPKDIDRLITRSIASFNTY